MIEMGIENPKISKEVLEIIESKIKNNVEDNKDLENLNTFISPHFPNYLLNLLKDNGISSYEQYLIERRATRDNQNPNLNFVIGGISAIISYLKKSL